MLLLRLFTQCNSLILSCRCLPDIENIPPINVELPPSPATSPEYPEEPPRTLTTLHEDREMSPTSPRKSWWTTFFGGGPKKEKRSKEEKAKEKKLKEEKHKEHKKEKKVKKKKRKAKKTKETEEKERDDDEVDGLPSEEEGTLCSLHSRCYTRVMS